MPLNRPSATASLGGFGRTRTIVTPLDRYNANASFGDLADSNHSYAFLGAWSCPTMVMPLDRLKASFAMVLFLPLLEFCSFLLKTFHFCCLFKPTLLIWFDYQITNWRNTVKS